VPLTVEDDFRDFVVACWPDLESAAMLVTLDADTARRVTADALAGLHHQWRDALERGVPGALARGAVLGAAVAATGPSDHGHTTTGPPVAGDEPVGESGDPARGPGDAAVLALADVLRTATPVQRAVLAGQSWWSLRPGEVATLLREPVTPVVRGSSALRDRLVTAHAAARVAEGLAPAGWSLDRDLDAAIGLLLEGLDDPPDPGALVAERRLTVRRRSLLVGAVGTLAAGAAGWWVLLDGTEVAGPHRRDAATTPGPRDASWGSTSSWAARGRLAGDAGIQALVLARSTQASRLIWADDVGSRRVVIAAVLDASESLHTVVRSWQGPRGVDPNGLAEVPLTLSTIGGVRDVVALTLADPDEAGSSGSSLVIVLGRPTEQDAAYSTLVVPTPGGGVRRRWTPLTLEGGVGIAAVDRPLSPATRVRVGAYDGPPATPDPLWLGGDSADADPRSFTSAVHAYVERATGIPAWRLHTEVVADSLVHGRVLDPAAPQGAGVDSRVVALRTHTPGGGVLSSVIVTDDARGGGDTAVVRPVVVIPADRTRDPVVERVGDERDGVARFLVVAPGAARIQLTSRSPADQAVSEVVPTRGRAAVVVPVVNGSDVATFRVVARGPDRRVLFDDEPTRTEFLLDLWSGG
jgi:hypothetical protein